VLGFSAGLLVGGDEFFILYGLAGAIGGYVPDLDLRYKHRKILHNIIIPFILFIIFYSLSMMISRVSQHHVVIAKAGYALLIGWLLHVFGDSLTSRGVYILWPFNKQYRLSVFKKLRSDSFLANFMLFALAFIFLYIWFEKYGPEFVRKAVEDIFNYLSRFLS